MGSAEDAPLSSSSRKEELQYVASCTGISLHSHGTAGSEFLAWHVDDIAAWHGHVIPCPYAEYTSHGHAGSAACKDDHAVVNIGNAGLYADTDNHNLTAICSDEENDLDGHGLHYAAYNHDDSVLHDHTSKGSWVHNDEDGISHLVCTHRDDIASHNHSILGCSKAYNNADNSLLGPSNSFEACKNVKQVDLHRMPDLVIACNEETSALHGHCCHTYGPHDSCKENCRYDVMDSGHGDGEKKCEVHHALKAKIKGGEADVCKDNVLTVGNDGSCGKECKKDVPSSNGSSHVEKYDNGVLYDNGKQDIESEIHTSCIGNYAISTQPDKIETLDIEETLKEIVIIPSIDKKEINSRLGIIPCSKRGLASISLKKAHRAPQSLLPSVRVQNSNSTNLWRVLANASFSTCLKLPQSNSSLAKKLPCAAPPKKASLSRSVSLPLEHCKASLQRLNPVSSLSGTFVKKNSVQSPQESSPSRRGSPQTSNCRPPLKPASLNIVPTPNVTVSQAPTSAAFARLIALPLVNAKAREEVRLDLRGQKVKSLDCNLVNLTAKLEFVYLRDNKLSHLAGIEILRRVKVLDLSFNEFKGLGMQPLASCKALQQLYLAGNQMTSLCSLPQLPNLEFLSVAQNKLKDLTMATQPKLKVLAASKNKIFTFKGFPHFPSLEHLRLEENPISDMQNVKTVAILLAGPNLKKFNNLDLTLEEQELACMYPPHAGLCIRDGWEFCGVEKAAVSSLRFLKEQWEDRIPAEYTLEQAFVEQPSEDYPCRCQFTLKKQTGEFEELELKFQYQWFIGGKTPSEFVPIEGAVKEVYWPKHGDIGHCLKVECVCVLGDVEYAPTFAVSFPVLPGTGCPKVINLNVNGDLKEGNIIRGNAEVAWCGGSATRGIVSWLRHDESCSPRMVPGAEELDYLLTLDDVGAKLILMYTPLSKEGIKGEPHFATTDVIQAGFPSVTDLRIVGEIVEGNTIRGVGRYFGGREGLSKFEWLQEVADSGGFQPISEGVPELTLTEKDVGLRIMFQYTPVNSEGFEGNPVSIVTERVSRAPPRVTSLKIVGELCEGSTASVSATICSGGIEGASRVRWFKTRVPNESLGALDMEEIGTTTLSEDFHIPLGAFGFYLLAEYTPVLVDGVAGEQVMAVSCLPVKMLPPSLTSVSMMGDHREGETLTASYSYVGGKEGSSKLMWYLHETESDPGSPIAEAVGLLEYSVTKAAINKIVSFKCIPVREDGCIGEEKHVMGQRLVQPGIPKLLSLDIVGDPMEGSHLQIVKSYCGGLEGTSKIQWFQTNSIGSLKQIEGATSYTYTSTAKDIDSYLCVSYEPCRSDGVTGSIVVSQRFGPVSPALPTCEALELCGETVEGQCLRFTAVYRGGVKGSSTCQWTRQQGDGLEKKINAGESLKLTVEDVGCCIKLVYTPVRKDGVSGPPKTVVSGVIRAGEPSAICLMIPNECEDVEIIPQKSYFGGVEGDSEFTWFRVEDRLKGIIDFSKAEAVGKLERYTPHLEDVGSYLALLWIPVRKDGKQGKPCLACSSQKVVPAPPLVHSVTVKRLSPSTFVGEGIYYGGLEGESQTIWYRQAADGVMTPIAGATSRIYTVKDDDYTYSLLFGFTPIRRDGAVGRLVLSAPTEKILPELPRVQNMLMTGKAIEGEFLVVTEEIPSEEKQQHVWKKYIKEVKYQWSRSVLPDIAESFEGLSFQRSCSYTVRTEDVGYFVRCECVVIDIFGRSSSPASVLSSAVSAGSPKVDNLEIEGRGYHTDMFAIRGIYSGGREGKSVIQWFRAMARSPDLVPIAGESGRMYEANVEDVGYRLVAVYTPVREDGVEGTPISASTDPVTIEPAFAEEVKEKLGMGNLRFEALLNRDPSSTKVPGHFEKRIIDVNKRRIKAMKPGSKTFLGMELRYFAPFHVEADKNDQHRLTVTMEGGNKIELMVQSKHFRDLIVLVIKGFKSTSKGHCILVP